MASIASSDDSESAQAVLDVHENTTPADYISLLQHLTGQISELQKDYNNRGDDIVKASTIFVAFQGALIGALFSSAGRIKKSIECDDFWNTLILLALFLSSLASLATIVVVLYNILEQLKLLKQERQYQQERDSVIDYCLQNARFTNWRFLFSTYRRGFAVDGNRTDSCWWLLRSAVIIDLIVFSASVFFFCTRLLCR